MTIIIASGAAVFIINTGTLLSFLSVILAVGGRVVLSLVSVFPQRLQRLFKTGFPDGVLHDFILSSGIIRFPEECLHGMWFDRESYCFYNGRLLTLSSPK